MGGWSTTKSVNDVLYSTDGVNWTQATASAEWGPRAWHTSVVYDNKIWVMGGYTSGESSAFIYYNDAWYSVDGVNWTQATDAADWPKRSGLASIVFNNKIWIMGGKILENGFKYFNDVWSHQGATDIENEAIGLPRIQFSFGKMYPQPFRNTLSIHYTLHTPAMTKITMYTNTGQRVKSLWSGHQPAGSHAVSWNSCDHRGRKLPNGMYVLRAEVDGNVVTKKILRVK